MRTLETISTGDELVRGRSTDTNAPWIARRCAEEGVLRVRHATIGDDPGALAAAFREAGERADFVVVTGGLGPTEDDHTRAAAAAAAGVGLVEDPDLLAEIEARFAERGIPMIARNRVQALLPEGAVPVRNPLGTAPGFLITLGRGRVFCLSGVPREMEVMFESGVLPVIREAVGDEGGAAYRSVSCFGKPEVWVDGEIDDLSAREDLSVGITATHGLIRVTIQTVGAGAAERADEAERIVRERLGGLVLEAPTLEASVAGLLADRGLTLATAESCTGGLVGGRLTAVPGVSAVYLGGVVAYSNEAKERHLGVPRDLLDRHGAVSEETVRAMAEGARDRFGADLAVAVTGIAGPDGGTEEKPVGTVWFAVAAPDGTTAKVRRFPGDREYVRRFAVNVALGCLRSGLVRS